jgi:hypothetical protein
MLGPLLLAVENILGRQSGVKGIEYPCGTHDAIFLLITEDVAWPS